MTGNLLMQRTPHLPFAPPGGNGPEGGLPRFVPRAGQADRRDAELVQDLLDGVERSFEVLVRRHEPAVRAFLRREIRCREEIADLCQEVFLKVFSRIDQYDPAYPFRAWLYRITVNTAVDWKRRMRRTRRQDALDESIVPIGVLPSTAPDPHAVYLAKETRCRLERAFQRVPESYRPVLDLRFRKDLRYVEIAAATGLSLGTVKNRIFRAREILRRDLQ